MSSTPLVAAVCLFELSCLCLFLKLYREFHTGFPTTRGLLLLYYRTVEKWTE